jgi:hypothetical protein
MGIRFRLTRYIETFAESAAGLRASRSVGRTPLGACPPLAASPFLPAIDSDTVRTISEKGTWIDANNGVLGYLRRSFRSPFLSFAGSFVRRFFRSPVFAHLPLPQSVRAIPYQ